MRSDGEAVILEFQTQDNIIGILRSKIKKIRIPVRDLSNIEIRRGLFKKKIIITPASMSAFKELNGIEGGKIILKIEGKSLPKAREFVNAIELLINEERLNEIENYE